MRNDESWYLMRLKPSACRMAQAIADFGDSHPKIVSERTASLADADITLIF
jgi:hypothetical protein